jgi:hypothetical protein
MSRFVAVVSLLLAAAGSGVAQSPSDPPVILQIVHGADAVAARPMADIAGSPAGPTIFAFRAITGLPEGWFIEAHNNFASVEVFDRQLLAHGAPHCSDDRSCSQIWLALFVPGWSYRPSEAVKLMQHARYWLATVYHARPGQEKDWAGFLAAHRAPQNFWSMEQPELAYHVIAGSEYTTSVFLEPLVTVAALDDGFARRWRAAPGGEMPETLSCEHILLRLQPEQSVVNFAFVQADPELWQAARRWPAAEHEEAPNQ